MQILVLLAWVGLSSWAVPFGQGLMHNARVLIHLVKEVEDQTRMINSPYSRSRNITSYSMKNLSFHSLLRWKMIASHSHNLTYKFLYVVLGYCTFWTWQWKGSGRTECEGGQAVSLRAALETIAVATAKIWWRRHSPPTNPALTSPSSCRHFWQCGRQRWNWLEGKWNEISHDIVTLGDFHLRDPIPTSSPEGTTMCTAGLLFRILWRKNHNAYCACFAVRKMHCSSSNRSQFVLLMSVAN